MTKTSPDAGFRPEERFSGETFDQAADGRRLTNQLDRVYALMRDGRWRTLREIARAVGGSEAGVSARLRDFRKERFQERCPALQVERRRKAGGLYEYRVVVA
jgi:hypothetical protein